MIDPIPDIGSRAFAKDFVDRFRQKIAIAMLQNGEPLLERRNSFRRIEIEDHERLGRPVVEYAIGLKRPAPHMSQSFPFTQVKFASLEICKWPLRPFRSSAQGVAF